LRQALQSALIVCCLIAAAGHAAATPTPAPTPAPINILTFHNDNMRSGLNPHETNLMPANVNVTTFGKLFSYPVDGYLYAEPLYVSQLAIPGQGAHNVVYVASEHDSVYAFDADGLVPLPLWHKSFIDPANGITTVSGLNDVGCHNLVQRSASPERRSSASTTRRCTWSQRPRIRTTTLSPWNYTRST
jgi:hypothetical protein